MFFLFSFLKDKYLGVETLMRAASLSMLFA